MIDIKEAQDHLKTPRVVFKIQKVISAGIFPPGKESSCKGRKVGINYVIKAST